MMKPKHGLKYYFVAIYKDGTHYTQTEDDVSIQGESFGSSFSDVRLPDLAKFVLAESQSNYWALDLATRTFSHNGTAFFIGDDLPASSAKTELVYFRRNYVYLSESGVEDKRVTYILGYKTSDDQRVIQLA